jgi:hypothetical protein
MYQSDAYLTVKEAIIQLKNEILHKETVTALLALENK